MKYLVVGVALLLAGAVVEVFADPYLPASVSNYQKGFDAAEKRVQDSGFGGAFRVPSEVQTLSGTVIAIQGDKLSVRTLAVDPFADPALNDRTIVITSDTKLIQIVPKDPKVFQNELTVSAKSGVTGKPAPVPFTEVVITVADIRVGDSFTVTASENIKTAATFTAQEIQIQPNAAPK